MRWNYDRLSLACWSDSNSTKGLGFLGFKLEDITLLPGDQ